MRSLGYRLWFAAIGAVALAIGSGILPRVASVTQAATPPPLGVAGEA